MSPAQNEVSSISAMSPARKVRKSREVSHRVVTNLGADYTHVVRKDAATHKVTPAALVRILVAEAYRARGVTPKQVKAQYLAHQAEVALAEAEAEVEEQDVAL